MDIRKENIRGVTLSQFMKYKVLNMVHKRECIEDRR